MSPFFKTDRDVHGGTGITVKRCPLHSILLMVHCDFFLILSCKGDVETIPKSCAAVLGLHKEQHSSLYCLDM